MVDKKTCGIITFENCENRLKDSVASSRIRGDWLVKYWEEAEIYRPGKKYDILIFQKAYWREMLAGFKGLKIFDICDPDWLHGRPIVEAINFCDAITCSTELLADELRKMTNKKVKVIPDRLDLDLYKKHKVHKGNIKKAVWFGYSTNFGQLPQIIQTLKRNGIRLMIIADKELPETDFRKWSLDTFNEDFLENDICILPDNTLYDPMFKYKSNNKEITSWALGMPVAKTIYDIRKFMCDFDRNVEAEKRRKEVKEKYDIKFSVKEFKELINNLKNG